MRMLRETVCVIVLSLASGVIPRSAAHAAESHEGAEIISSHGYNGCVRLFNDAVQVVLEPNCGGRLLEYSLNGVNALYVDPAQDGWTFRPGEPSIDPSGGRFDIGPEMTAPRRPFLWLGPWTAEITGPRSARMTSIEDRATGVRLIREFELDARSSRSAAVRSSRTPARRCAVTTTGAAPSPPRRHLHRTALRTEPVPLGYIYYGPGRSSTTVTSPIPTSGCGTASSRYRGRRRRRSSALTLTPDGSATSPPTISCS